MKIEYVNHSLANNFGDTIELHKDLIKYPELHDSILEHELGHSNDPDFNVFDLKHDTIKPSKVNQWQLFKFMLLHPSAWSQLLPAYYNKKHGLVYDSNLIIIYSVIIMLLVGGVTLGIML